MDFEDVWVVLEAAHGVDLTHTSVVRTFCPGYFPHFVSGLEPRHIGVRPKGTPFGPRLLPEAIESLLCLGSK